MVIAPEAAEQRVEEAALPGLLAAGGHCGVAGRGGCSGRAARGPALTALAGRRAPAPGVAAARRRGGRPAPLAAFAGPRRAAQRRPSITWTAPGLGRRVPPWGRRQRATSRGHAPPPSPPATRTPNPKAPCAHLLRRRRRCRHAARATQASLAAGARAATVPCSSGPPPPMCHQRHYLPLYKPAMAPYCQAPTSIWRKIC